MATAVLWSKESYCKRNQVGALISFADRSTIPAFNGTISGTKNDCEKECPKCGGDGKQLLPMGAEGIMSDCVRCRGMGIVTNDFTLHAEANAITHAANEGISLKGTTIYVTMSPCKDCAKLIAQAGIVRVVYKDVYRDTSGLDFLESLGTIKLEKHNESLKAS